MEEKFALSIVRIGIDVIDSISIECAGPPDKSVNFIALQKKKLGKITTILTGDAGNQCLFSHFETSVI